MSGCGVCIGGGEGDGYWDFSNCKEVVARKDHKCGECHRPITKKTRHEHYTGLADGYFYSERTCLDCVNIRNGLSCDGQWPVFGELWSEIQYEFRSFNMGCVAKVKTTSAKEYLLKRWAEWKGLQ